MGLVSAALNMGLTMVKELTGQADAASSSKRKITFDQFNKTGNYTPTSSLTASDGIAQKIALSSGAKTLDLTNLPDINGGTVTGNGKKVRAVLLRNLTGNADMTFVQGASNGYGLLGSSFSFTLKADQVMLLWLENGAPSVGGSAKTIDITGTGAQYFEIEVLFS